MLQTVSEFDEFEWGHASRCAGWSNRDVISHLEGTNRFWVYSIRKGLDGTPSEMLAEFDPVETPAQLVDADSGRSIDELLEAFGESTTALCDLIESLDGDRWTALAEAPPGHQHIGALVHHAHWDSWVHERDILVPLDAELPAMRDEAIAALRYAVALGPALAVNMEAASPGTLAVELDDGPESLHVQCGDDVHVLDEPPGTPADVTFRGSAVQLVEELSLRDALTQPVGLDSQWVVGQLATS